MSFVRPDLPRDGSEESPTIVIPVQPFTMRQGPIEVDSPDDHGFVGREMLVTRLVELLFDTRADRGSYLLAGFRGVGKTSIINRAIGLYRKFHSADDLHPSRKESELLAACQRGLDKARTAQNQWETGSKSQLGTEYKPTRAELLKAKLHACSSLALPWLQKCLGWCSSKSFSDLGDKLQAFVVHSCRINSRPVVLIRLNLGHDSALRPRDIMFEIVERIHDDGRSAYLLHRAIVGLTSLLTCGMLADNLYSSVSSLLIPSGLSPATAPFSPLDLTAITLFCVVVGLAVPHLWLQRDLRRLLDRISYSEEVSRGVKTPFLNATWKTKRPPLDDRKIETSILRILVRLRRLWWCPADVIFLFDELDKIGTRAEIDDAAQKYVPGDSSAPQEDESARQKTIQNLLSGLKTLITTGEARFFFVAGRDMLDAYQAERGTTSSLYESLFSQYFEVPSLLTDTLEPNHARLSELIETYCCRRLIDSDVALFFWAYYTAMVHKHRSAGSTTTPGPTIPHWNQKDFSDFFNSALTTQENLAYSPYRLRTLYHYICFCGVDHLAAQRVVHTLRNFVHYLTIHSAGNSKKLSSLFNSFARPLLSELQPNTLNVPGATASCVYGLRFTPPHQRSLALASTIYISLHHHLSRQLRSGGDKLAVSTVAAVHFLLKFHGFGFSRHHLDRMTEMLQGYRPPELKAVLDTLVTLVLRPYVQKTRSGAFRYRFLSTFEDEIRFVARTSDLEAATFNFSLAAMDNIKGQYRQWLARSYNLFGGVGVGDIGKGARTIAELNIVLGELLSIEGSNDVAVTHYETAIDALERAIEQNIKSDRNITGAMDPAAVVTLVEASLKLGHLEERRQRYDHAATSYAKANHAVEHLLGHCDSEEITRLHSAGAGVRDIVIQPFWALRFLALKRSPRNARIELEEAALRLPDHIDEDSPATQYRLGQQAMYFNHHRLATKHYLSCITELNLTKTVREQSGMLGGYCCLHLAENLVVGAMKAFQKELQQRDRDDDVEALTNAMVDLVVELMRFDSHGLTEEFYRPDGERFNQILENLEAEAFIKDGEVTRPGFRFDTILILYAMARHQFWSNALYFHAGVAGLSLVSLWTMLYDLIPWDYITDEESDRLSTEDGMQENHDERRSSKQLNGRKTGDGKHGDGCAGRRRKLLAAWENGRNCIAVILEQTGRGMRFSSDHSHQRFIETFIYRDVPGWPDANIRVEAREELARNSQEAGLKHDDSAFVQAEVFGNPVRSKLFCVTDLPRESSSLGATFTMEERIEAGLSESWNNVEESQRNSVLWQLSLPEQRVGLSTLWTELVFAILDGRDFGERHHFAQRDLPEFGTRSAVFFHWLNGRRLLEDLKGLRAWLKRTASGEAEDDESSEMRTDITIGMCRQHSDDRWAKLLLKLDREVRIGKASRDEGDEELCLANEAVIDRADCVYLLAGKAVQNLYSASWQMRILSGNDQALMFPPPAFVYFHLWGVLRICVEWERSGGRFFDKAVIRARQRLVRIVSSDVPASHVDYRYIRDRAIRYVRSSAKMGDVTGRARAEILKNKLYLKGDYDDSEFQLDWTLLHMIGPTAWIVEPILRKATNELGGAESKHLSDETFWSEPVGDGPGG